MNSNDKIKLLNEINNYALNINKNYLKKKYYSYFDYGTLRLSSMYKTATLTKSIYEPYDSTDIITADIMRNTVYRSTNRYCYNMEFIIRNITGLEPNRRTLITYETYNSTIIRSFRTAVNINLEIARDLFNPYYPYIYNKACIGNTKNAAYKDTFVTWFITMMLAYDEAFFNFRNNLYNSYGIIIPFSEFHKFDTVLIPAQGFNTFEFNELNYNLSPGELIINNSVNPILII